MSKLQPIQISIPQPCHEDWSKMTPTQQGRFCNACQKCVVDFTTFTDRQLYEFLNKYKDQYICGRTYTNQLNRNIYPKERPYKHYINKFFIAIGTAILTAELPSKSLFAQTPYEQAVYEQPNTDTVAKQVYTLSGIVRDNNGEPLIGAFIEVMQNGTICNTVKTDEDGKYSIILKSGVYAIKTTYTGFVNETAIINLSDKDVRTITIMKESMQLTEMTITTGGMIHIKEDRRPNFWQRITNWLR